MDKHQAVQHVLVDIQVKTEQQYVIYQYQHDNIYEQRVELLQQHVHHEHINELIM